MEKHKNVRVIRNEDGTYSQEFTYDRDLGVVKDDSVVYNLEQLNDRGLFFGSQQIKLHRGEIKIDDYPYCRTCDIKDCGVCGSRLACGSRGTAFDYAPEPPVFNPDDYE